MFTGSINQVPVESGTLPGMAETQVSQGRGVLCSHGTGRIEDEMVDAVYVNQIITK